MAKKRMQVLLDEINESLGTNYSIERVPNVAYKIGYWQGTIFVEKNRYNTAKEMEAFLEGLKYYEDFTK